MKFFVFVYFRFLIHCDIFCKIRGIFQFKSRVHELGVMRYLFALSGSGYALCYRRLKPSLFCLRG